MQEEYFDVFAQIGTIVSGATLVAVGISALFKDVMSMEWVRYMFLGSYAIFFILLYYGERRQRYIDTQHLRMRNEDLQSELASVRNAFERELRNQATDMPRPVETMQSSVASASTPQNIEALTANLIEVFDARYLTRQQADQIYQRRTIMNDLAQKLANKKQEEKAHE